DESAITLSESMKIGRKDLIHKLIDARYERNDITLSSGSFRVKGDTIDIIPGYSDDIIRVSLFGDQIEKISIHNNVTMARKRKVGTVKIFPAKHYIIDENAKNDALSSIQRELEDWVPSLPGDLERQRLTSRTKYDLEMIQELGYCSGIENYSRHLDGRKTGQPPFCLLDFFGSDFLLVIDESHVTLPQLRGMFLGDFTRKKSLVDYGFRLPSAFDNRPLTFTEFEGMIAQIVYVSATPGPRELEHVAGKVIEQVIRPTGLMDPVIEVRPARGQVDDLLGQV